MARYDPDEYEGTDPEPFGQMAPSYIQQQAQLREQRRIRDLALQKPAASIAPIAPQATPTTQTTLPSAPVNTFMGEGGGVGGRGGGRYDDPTAFDDFGNLGDYGGGTYSPSTIRFEQARQGLAPLPQLAPMLPQATPTTQSTLPSMIAPTTTAATTPTTTPTAPTTPATAPAFPTAAPTMNVPPLNLNLEQLGGGYGQFDPVVSSFLNQFAPALQRGAFMEPAPEVTGRLQDVLTTGGRIPESMETYGAGLAGQPTGGAAPTQDLLSQFIAGNIGGANIPVQTAANQQLQNLMQGAGVSAPYAQAARETVFDPSMEAMQGRINQMGGGVADMTGGLSQELQRRHERDFMNQMLMTGQQQLPQYLQLGLAGGQQQFGQAAQAAGQAGQREQLLGAFGEGGITQGMAFLNQMAQMRAAQEDQLGGIVRALLSGMVEPQPSVWGNLIPSLLQGGPAIAQTIGSIAGADWATDLGKKIL